MATFAADDVSLVLNSVDISDQVRSVSLPLTREELDDTAMGDDARSRIAGLRDGTLTVEFNQDFAASETDATLWAIYNSASGVVTFTVKPTSAAVSATNPSYSGSVCCTGYSPVDNGVGELATTSVSWPLASGSGITRATS